MQKKLDDSNKAKNEIGICDTCGEETDNDQLVQTSSTTRECVFCLEESEEDAEQPNKFKALRYRK